MADKKETLTRLCALTSKVMKKVFRHQEPADCFCYNNHPFTSNHDVTSNKVLEFIENAVDKAIKDQ